MASEAREASVLKYRNAGNGRLLGMLPTQQGKVLDCGCGAGDNACLLKRSGWTVIGVTNDPDEAAAASPYCARVLIADLAAGIPPEAGDGFDAILMSHVLEHLAHPEVLLDQVRGCLSTSGVLAIALPNVLHYRSRLRFMLGDFSYTDTGTLDRTHLRFYTVHTARKLIQDAGYRIVEEIDDGGLPWMWMRKLTSPALRDRVDRFAAGRWPNLFAHQTLIIARAVG